MSALLAALLLVSQTPTNPPSQQKPPTGIASPETNTPPAKPVLSSALSTADRDFLKTAALGSMAQVELGTLAGNQAQSDEVKQFARGMAADHSKALAEIQRLAAAKNLALPHALDATQKANVKKLSKMNGSRFDKAYLAGQIKVHQRDIAEFERESAAATDPAVKEFASKTLPILKTHSELAAQLGSRSAQ